MKRKIFVVAAMIIGSRLPAQDDTTGKSLDEVVITANKYPNKTSLTGKVLTVISRRQLERSGGKDLAQILTEQTGLYINGANSNAGKDKSVYLRGARVDHTLITIDGVPVYDASGIGGNFDIRNMAIDNIERIEILKGSQSTLYGSDAMAGVINIITKKPEHEGLSSHGLLLYGNNATRKISNGISGRSGPVNYHIDASYFKTRGINEALNKNSSSVFDRDGFLQENLQAGLGGQFKKITIRSYFRYNKTDGDIDQGAFTDELDYTFTQKSFQAGIRNEFSFNKAKLTVLYNYNHINRLYIDDSVKSRNGFDTYSRGSYEGDEHFIDAYAHVPFSNLLKLTAGADFRSSNSDQEYFSVGFFGPYTSKYGRDSLSQNQLGLYAALTMNADCGLSVEAGNRLNIHSAYGSNYVFNLNPSYLINKQIKLFANLSSGYRTPSLYQLYAEYGNKNLQPESALTAEGGVQYFSATDKLSGRITAFRRTVRDVIFFYFNSSTFQSQYINQDKQKDHGLELEVQLKPLKNIFIKAFYTYVDGEITTKQNGKDTTYFNLLRRPKHSAGLNLGCNVTERFFISTNLQAVGKRKDAYFDSQTFQTVQATLDSYTLWDIYAEYSFFKNRMKFFVDLRNITASHFTEVSGFNTLGFNGYGGVRFSF